MTRKLLTVGTLVLASLNAQADGPAAAKAPANSVFRSIVSHLNTCKAPPPSWETRQEPRSQFANWKFAIAGALLYSPEAVSIHKQLQQTYPPATYERSSEQYTWGKAKDQWLLGNLLENGIRNGRSPDEPYTEEDLYEAARRLVSLQEVLDRFPGKGEYRSQLTVFLRRVSGLISPNLSPDKQKKLLAFSAKIAEELTALANEAPAVDGSGTKPAHPQSKLKPAPGKKSS